MIRFFQKRTFQKKKLEQSELLKKLERVEEQLEELMKNNKGYHVHIEHVSIDKPVLENLTFRMDALDIHELSGALNLGNNFGMKMDDKPKSNFKEEKKEEKTVNKQSSTVSQEVKGDHMKQTKRGYSYHL